MTEPLDPAQPHITLDLLKAVCRKGGWKSQHDPFWLIKYLFRPWSIYVTWLCVKLGVSANGASFVSAVAIFAAAILYGLTWPVAWVIGGVCVQCYLLLDVVDGELGRLEREALGKKTGMSGHFCDTVCHAGGPALMAALAMRLYVDLNHPWWLLALAVIAFFPGNINPWQRYCESLAMFGQRAVVDGKVILPARYVFASTWAVPQHAGPDLDQPALGRRLVSFIAQAVGYPGYWLTLLVCTLLDVVPGVPQLHVGGFATPYLLIWFAVRALHSGAASIKSTLAYARRLRSLS